MGPETHKRIWLMHTATGHFSPIEPSPRCQPEDHAALNPHIVKIEDCTSREIIWQRKTLTTPSAWLPVAMALGVVAWAYILGVV
mgnify:FL=1